MICGHAMLSWSPGNSAVTVAIIWVAVAAVWAIAITPWLSRGPDGSASIGLIWRLTRGVLHRRQSLQFEGLEILERAVARGGVIIVANHTGGVDPLLIQAATPQLIRWMMAKDMMASGTDDIWRWLRIIPVHRDRPDPASIRTALTTIRRGGVLGIFPEGRITRPPGTLRPFQEGVGLLAARTGATIVPCWISGTPDAGSMLRSILGRSRSRVVFLPPVTYPRTQPANDVALDIRSRIAAASGWPLNEDPMPLVISGLP
jgi:1-acyl-sn-glycerol-3-phosphate acyltransferase